MNDDDLTARARIRDAAMRQFAELGYARATIRGIAAAAGVSLGLVRHHFGSKEALRDAVDAHVLGLLREINDQLRNDGEQGNFSTAAMGRGQISPLFTRYFARALLDGSPTVATMFDHLVEMTESWVDLADKRNGPAHSHRRWRAAVLTAMAMGIPLLNEHLSRAIGADILTPEGERRMSLAELDIYSTPLISPELADTARTALEDYYHGRTQ